MVILFPEEEMPRSNKKKHPYKPPPRDPTDNLSFNEVDLSKNESTLMVFRAISSAKKHGITLRHGRSNAASGNCAFESALSNVNDRDCFSEKYPFSHLQYRRIWMTDMRNRYLVITEID